MYLSAKSEVKKSSGSLSFWETVRDRVFHPLANRRPSPSPSQRAGDLGERREWMGVEPTAARCARPANGFEDRSIHRDTTTPTFNCGCGRGGCQ